MSEIRPSRIDRDAAERLLDRVPTAAEAATPLAAQLLAASAPAHPDELAGERMALVAFTAAQLAPVTRQRRPSMLKIALAKLLTIKAAAVVAAVGAGGIALAAGTGVLPTQVADTPADPPAVTESTARPADLPSPAAGAGDAAGGNPSPSMAGLCHAYAAEVGDNRGKALQSPAFAALVGAAGGADNVDGYCETATADAQHPGGAPSGVPVPPAVQDGAGESASHAQVPTSRPQAPAGPPSGAPTAPPTPSR